MMHVALRRHCEIVRPCVPLETGRKGDKLPTCAVRSLVHSFAPHVCPDRMPRHASPCSSALVTRMAFLPARTRRQRQRPLPRLPSLSPFSTGERAPSQKTLEEQKEGGGIVPTPEEWAAGRKGEKVGDYSTHYLGALIGWVGLLQMRSQICGLVV
ncbi:hypothetical protein BDZ85DRAFT_96219 [Elsinoe ampelina]|uniref:Uncharacterized protein n=1 Tax=Elsinoe ampelina TaxID=302913 RepID=A0A6A6GE75_9PEZI|nr:hypothetical protein BDZ85DRAFT_96219 [Elsinoe ampelina]